MLPWTLRRWLGLPHPDAPSEPVDPSALSIPPDPVRPAWEAAVRADPSDREARRAYGEALRAARDPRGDLVLAMLDGADAGPLVAAEPALLGPLALEDGVEVEWDAGLWRAIAVRRTWGDAGLGSLLRAVLAHPAALVLERLEVRADTAAAVADALADGEPTRLRELVVDAGLGQLGTWEPAWPRLQRLEILELTGLDPQLGAMSAPALRALSIDARTDDENLGALARAALPALTRLDLRVEGASADAIRAVRERFPAAEIRVGPRG